MKSILSWMLVAALLFLSVYVVRRVAQLLSRPKPRHQMLEETTDTLSSAGRIAAAIGALGFWIAAPTGLAAIGANFGIVTVPLIVVLAPALGVIAITTGALAAGAKLYAKHQRDTSSS